MGKHARAERHGEQKVCMWRQSIFVKVSALMKANLPYFLESGFLLNLVVLFSKTLPSGR